MNTKLTGTDLAERGLEALDVTHYDQMPVDNAPVPGAISNVDWMKVFDLGKALAAMKEGMPSHVRGAWGIGCRIATNAYNWKMDPFAIADQTYVVNNRLAYMSQLIHALINLNAGLVHRLSCEYIGEGGDRQCIVRGQFITGDEREYKTPKLKDIKVKNSPLWQSDSDQQLWYFGVRSWGRKWVPEVMLGVYTREELEQDPNLGYEAVTPGLHARLKGSAASSEGHKAGHAAAQLDQIETGGTIEHEAADAQAAASPKSSKHGGEGSDTPKETKRTSKPRKPAAPLAEENPKETLKEEQPTTIAQYAAYARRWIKATSSAVEIGERWSKERKLRNALGMTAEDREPLEKLIKAQTSK